MVSTNRIAARMSLFTDTAESLWGLRWRLALAESLGVSERTVRRWAAGEFPIPPGIYAELLTLAEDRRKRLKELGPLLKKAAQG